MTQGPSLRDSEFFLSFTLVSPSLRDSGYFLWARVWGKIQIMEDCMWDFYGPDLEGTNITSTHIPFVFVFWKFDCSVSQCRSLWIHLTWSWWNFLDVYIHTFHQISEVFSQDFYKYSLFPFPSLSLLLGLPQCVCLVCLCAIGSFGSSLLNLFSFCSLDLIIFIVLSSSLLILYSACSNLPLNPSNDFSFQL